MCGLVGAAGNLFTIDRKAFRNLLVLDVLRGDHSTGIAVVDTVGNSSIMKEVGNPYNLFNSFKEKFENGGIIKSAASKVLIGHNRYGTMGKIVAENAHPFQHGDIVGAHNGTLERNWLKNLDDHNKFEVDSEALIYNIAIHGPEILKKVAGAYALTWWDAKQKKMFFIRNDKRPLHYTRSKDKDGFFWASEPWMLEYGLKKAGISHSEIGEFEKDHLYSLDVSNCSMKFREVELIKGDKIEGFTPPPMITVIGGRKHMMNTQGHMGGTNPFQNGFFHGHNSTPNITQVQHVGSNVPRNTSAREYAKKLAKYVGKSISFWSDYERKSPTGQYFLSCSPVNTEDDFEIRLYTKGREVHEQYRTAIGSLVGTVKKVVHNIVNGKHEIYLLMDYRTIYIPPDPTKAPDNTLSKRSNIIPFTTDKKDFRGFMGTPLTEEQWIEATSQGCAYCDAAVEPENADKLRWFGRTDFLCEECSADPDKSKYAY